MFALAGAAHGFCAHGIGGVGEYSGQCSDSIGKQDNNNFKEPLTVFN